MPLFISYSSQDRSTVDALTTALRRAQQQVWFDQELGGGDSWWNKILEQIRSCDLFVVALSNNWLQSKPSQSELRYARALNRPILPVRIGDVDSMRVNPLATLQIIDYREPTVDAGIQLVTAVHALSGKPVPLPDPLPEEPPVPFGYITRLGNTLAEKELSPQQQLQLLVELRSGFDEDGDDPSARGDIAQLLRMLRLRHDVTYRTRTEIDNVLAEIEAKDAGKAAPAKAAASTAAQQKPATATPPSAAAARPASAPAASRPATGGTSNRRVILIGAAVLAVVAVIAIVYVMVGQSDGKKSPTAARPATGAATGQGAGGQAPPGPGAPAPGGGAGPLDTVLLGAPQVSSIMGAPSMEIANQTRQIRPNQNLSNAECLGPYDAIQTGPYAGSGFTAVSGQELKTQDNGYRVYEGAVSFPNADKAHAFVAAQADKWKACNGQTVTASGGGGSSNWSFENLTGAAPRIEQVRNRKDGSSCQHVLSAVSDVVLDVRACAPGIQNQAGQIADQMAANVK